MSHMKVSLYSYFQLCRYFQDPWVSFVTANGFSVRVQGLVSHELTAYLSDFDLLLNPRKWVNYQKYINGTTLNYTTL